MSQFRKFAIALIALSAIAGTTIAANGIEVLVQGIEVLGPSGAAVHTLSVNAPAGAMVFAMFNDGQNEHIVDMQPIAADGTSTVSFPVLSTGSRIVLGFLTSEGIEVLAFSSVSGNPFEGGFEFD